MRKPIVIWPDSILQRANAPVLFDEKSKDDLRQLLLDMRETMNAEKGLGLAAPQIGVNKMVLLVRDGIHIIEMMNPAIARSKEKQTSKDEGCLSFPGERLDIERSATISVAFQDRDGNEQEMKHVTGMLAIEIQHEVDHLLGITLADYMGSMRRDIARRRLNKVKGARTEWERIQGVQGDVRGYSSNSASAR